MPKKRVRARAAMTAPPDPTHAGGTTHGKRSASPNRRVVELGNTAYNGECPLCGKPKLNVRRRTNGRGWWVQCWVCPDGKTYLDELAEAVGCRPYQLIEDAPKYLGFLLDAAGADPLDPGLLPSIEQRKQWRDELLGSPERLDALRAERGLRPEAVRRFRLGWDRARLGYTHEVRNARGELVNISWRAPKGRVLHLTGGAVRNKHRIHGRGVEGGYLPLYPMPLPRSKWWLLVEGEWDALVAQQEGLPAITGLLGTQWHDEWSVGVAGKRIAVAYDVGVEREANTTARRLLAAGAEAWVVDLGLPNEGDDVCDWFVTYGRTADDLTALCRRAAA